MDNLDLLQKFLDIRESLNITESIIKTVYNDNCLSSDRLEWLLIGAAGQMEKAKQMLEIVMEVVGGTSV